ncbi:hypothetical protein NUU61_004759 [Penicillium alfredii]|uniref:Peptidase S8/S53 domain-containing protein n=1 Tax=Penicillium alfredii TaxID=1506179 RepID=A0A9W9F867_9EURO|nr:uncharacterized protein NUU61_004759 [Penicillium alfredii]KAJ5095403.1 hypothetical protein NUU61_004759 [Penicillium alfredii]
MRCGIFAQPCLLVFLLLCLSGAIADTSEKPYLIRTKSSTPVSTFDAFIQELDEGQGKPEIFPDGEYQSYQTNLTESQAEEIRQKDFILLVFPAGIANEVKPRDPQQGAVNDTSEAPSEGSRLERRQRHTPRQLQFVSWNGLGEAPDDLRYRRDSSDGAGVPIFVIDSGFNIHHPELARHGRRVFPWAVPETAMPSQMRIGGRIWDRLPQQFDTDYEGHGTKMAALAAGTTLGAARFADLHLIKASVDYDYQGNRGTRQARTSYETWRLVFRYIVHVLRAQAQNARMNGFTLKAIVSISGDRDRVDDDEQTDRAYWSLFQDFAADLNEYGVPLVVAAGNDGLEGRTLDDSFLTALSRPGNNIIPIGGVQADGTLWIQTTPDGRRSRISAYTVCTDLDTLDDHGRYISHYDSGTSPAAAITSGMLATWLSIDLCNVPPVFQDVVGRIFDRYGNPNAVGIKNQLERVSYQKNHRKVPRGTPRLPYELPLRVNSIYNWARGRPVTG